MEIKNFIFGASGHAKVVLDILLFNKISIEAVVDDNPKSDTLLTIPVILSSHFKFLPSCRFLIAIGNNANRKKVVEKRFSYN